MKFSIANPFHRKSAPVVDEAEMIREKIRRGETVSVSQALTVFGAARAAELNYLNEQTKARIISATQPAKDNHMTLLQHIGSVLKKILHIGEEAAVIAQPFVAASFPEILPIYSTALGLALDAEASSATLTGTGPQKLAQVVANLTPQIEAWAKQNGIVWDTAGITKWTSALVDTLNLIPAPTVAPTPAAPAA